MPENPLNKLSEKVDELLDKMPEGCRLDDAPVDLPGTFKTRDHETKEVIAEETPDTGRQDDIPVPGAKPPR